MCAEVKLLKVVRLWSDHNLLHQAPSKHWLAGNSSLPLLMKAQALHMHTACLASHTLSCVLASHDTLSLHHSGTRARCTRCCRAQGTTTAW